LTQYENNICLWKILYDAWYSAGALVGHMKWLCYWAIASFYTQKLQSLIRVTDKIKHKMLIKFPGLSELHALNVWNQKDVPYSKSVCLNPIYDVYFYWFAKPSGNAVNQFEMIPDRAALLNFVANNPWQKHQCDSIMAILH